MVNIKRLILVVSVMLLAACVTMPAPQSLSQRIAIAEATLTGVLDSTAHAVTMKRISKEQGEKALALAEQVDSALSLSRASLNAGDANDALGRLRIAQQLLLEIETLLNAQKPTSKFSKKEAFA